MSQESKYYTPSIEEFHVGFEYEVLNHFGDFIPIILSEDMIIVPPYCDYDTEQPFYFKRYGMDRFRVKHLDRQDIENEGWDCAKLPGQFGPDIFFKLSKDSENERMGHTDWSEIRASFWVNAFPTIEITIGRSGHESGVEGFQYIAFRGTIKNVSEFRRLMTQLGITKPNT